jgi:hypothetical protein
MATSRFITVEGDEVFVAQCTKPARVEYHERAWWAFTRGRAPDIEVAGPCAIKSELYRQLARLAAQGQLTEKWNNRLR